MLERETEFQYFLLSIKLIFHTYMTVVIINENSYGKTEIRNYSMEIIIQISAGTDGGPHSRVCSRLTLRSAPHRHQQKFFAAHVCKIVFTHLPSTQLPIR